MGQTHLAPVLSASAMKEADRFTIEEVGIPGFTLMESAGRECALIAHEMLGNRSDPLILIACGKGNNGGDGFVVARYLAQDGIRVAVLLSAEPQNYTGEARANLEIISTLVAKKLVTDLSILDFDSGMPHLASADLIVDALLGTGLVSDVRAPFTSVIEAINASAAPVLSIDIASGLHADSGRVMGVAVDADVTATMASAKAGHLIGDGPDFSGDVQVVDIGIAPGVLEIQAGRAGCGHLSDNEYVRDLMRPRERSDHKYSSGPSLIVGGSIAFPGAVALAARGAARAGSGYVVCCGPEEIRPFLLEKLDEIPVESWNSGSPDAVADMIQRLDLRWKKSKAMLIGPGMGREIQTKSIVQELLSHFDGYAVVDADALFALNGEKDWVADNSGGKWIFTPHDGEFLRLVGESEEPVINRIEIARRFAAEWNVTLLLKGQPSITASPDGSVMVNATGNPGAGTAGSGDVLAGIVAGLLAQGLPPFEAATCGIHLAGTAADDTVEGGASQSIMASDILEALPGVLSRLDDPQS